MKFILAIICLNYLILIGRFIFGWNSLRPIKNVQPEPHRRFSVIIPFRNEAANLPSLLQSLLDLEYPRDCFEVILINDASSDNSEEIIREFIDRNINFQVSLAQNIRKTKAPKKDAILTGVAAAKFEYMVNTDADCLVPNNWLKLYNSEINTSDPSLIAGPVGFKNVSRKNFIQIFEELDFISLQATGAAAFGMKKSFLCNGANLCYKKEDFLQLNAFDGNQSISSGDDVFTLQKFIASGKKVSFLNSEKAIVTTNFQTDFRSLFEQRFRWAAKTPAYKSIFAKYVGISVFLMNFSLLVGFLLFAFDYLSGYFLFIIFIIKFLTDLFLLFPAAKFFGKKYLLKHYFWCAAFYPFFTIAVALSSVFTGYKWKGRKFKR